MSDVNRTPEPGRRKKVSSRDPFSPYVPFDVTFKERMPAVFVFQAVLANLHYLASSKPMPILGEAVPTRPHQDEWLAAECGVYRGHALVAYAELARRSAIPIHFYGLDTFAGLPQPSAVDREYLTADSPSLTETLFADTSVEEVRQRIEERGLGAYITLLAGQFQTTLPKLPDGQFFFVSVDCDLYEPHLQCLEYFYPRMIRGGVIYIDDYHSVEFPMARRAVDEFMRGRSEQLFHLRYGEEGRNQTKAYLVKF
jgi:O-methyltransferase